MQIPLKWINELVNIENLQLDELIEKLTLGGFEVEEILELEINGEKQTVLDISTTANRSDSLSIQGISMEIASLLDKPIKKSSHTKEILEWREIIKEQVKPLSEEFNCSIFLAITLKNLTDSTSPLWLQEKLISSGVTPENNLSDFQAYLLLETGYPFAFYDLNQINDKLKTDQFTLSLSHATNKEEFFATNDLTYELSNSNLIVKANDLPISLAGIIEQKDFSYSEKTSSLLIEASIFNAATIRQQSRFLGLRTDRSARYEKSLKSTYLIESLYRLISLLRVKNPNLVCKVHTFLQAEEAALPTIQLNYQTINEILGPITNAKENTNDFISVEQISNYLTRLNFTFSYNESNLIWEVQVPHLRSDDITREIDLIEEIGRLHGFNNFLTTLPKIKRIGIEDKSYQTRKKLTSCFVNFGLNELIHYSLVGQKQSTDLGNEIRLVNPLLSEYGNLRTSLLPSLLQTVEENLKQSNRVIEGFEYGHVFSGKLPNDVSEIEHVAGIFGGTERKLMWDEIERGLTWFEAKGKIEQLFEQLNIKTHWKAGQENGTGKLFHPYRNAELSLLDGSQLGKFGQVNPILADQIGLTSETYLFEFNLEVIQNQIQINKLPIYQEYSSYPRIIKDLSFIVNDNVSFDELKELLYLNGTKFLSEINLLDEYRGDSIPDQSTSLCVQLIFQSNEKTLQNKEIETIITNLQLVLTNELKAIIRG